VAPGRFIASKLTPTLDRGAAEILIQRKKRGSGPVREEALPGDTFFLWKGTDLFIVLFDK
jgi:hypothetical protein